MKPKAITGLLIGGAAVLFSADAVEAEHPREATGDCQASAQVVAGPLIDAYADGGETFEIPLAGAASYTGRVGSGDDREIRDFNGEIVIKTPPGIPDIELTGEWVWSGSGPGAAKNGDVMWDLPSVMPRGVAFRVEGFHTDNPEFCEGYVNVKIAGGALDSALAPISLGGTALAAAGVAFAGLRKGVSA